MLKTEEFIGQIRWKFLQSVEAIRKQEFSDTLPRASVQDLGIILMGAGYKVVLSNLLLLGPFDFSLLSSFKHHFIILICCENLNDVILMFYA